MNSTHGSEMFTDYEFIKKEKNMRNFVGILIFTLSLVPYLHVHAQNVHMPDENLAAAVRSELGLAQDAPITHEALQRLIFLEAPRGPSEARQLHIQDLTGLEQATRLRELEINGHSIVDLSPLAGLTNLIELDLGSNAITDISPLKGLTNLTDLSLRNNPLTDLSPLKGLTKLTRLRLWRSALTDLSPLAGLTSLRNLELISNALTDLSPLEKLTNLTRLSLGRNALTDLSPLKGLTNLTHLDIDRNSITDLSPLAGLTKLTSLSANNNAIMDLSPLEKLTNLTKLDLQANNITDISPLKGMVNLILLELGRNPIEDLSPLCQLLDRNPDLLVDITEYEEGIQPDDCENETPESSHTLVSLEPATVESPAVGEQLTLNLNITEGEAVAGYQASVQFDTTALRYVSSANGDYLPAGAFFVDPVVAGNLIKLNAASLAEESNGDGTLATLTFEVIARKASTVALSDVLLTNKAGEAAVPQIENAEITEATILKTDVNSDGIVNIQDLVLVASNLGKTGQNAADVNSDGLVNIQDLVLVAGALGTGAAAPSLNTEILSTLSAADVKLWVSQAQHLHPTDVTSQKGILFLQQLLAVLIPKETVLLANFPNPFNPETWIPYQLSKPTDVTLTIYDIKGSVIRALDLGHQRAGVYQNRSRAAYWDGRNAVGEKVASGVYFYTLTAGDFSATRKMLIQK